MKPGLSAFLLIASLFLNACTSTGPRVADGTKAAQANVELGVAYFREGRMNLAMEKLQKALEQDPGLPVAHSAIAVVYERLGETGPAERHYERALSLAPQDAKVHNNYGQFLCRQGRLEEADRHFQKAVSDPLYESPEAAYTNAGICARRIPDDGKAEGYFRKALEKNPVFPMALLQMLMLSYDQGEYLRARAYLQRFQQASRHNAESLWYGVRVEYALGDRDAVASYGLALKNNFPDAPQTRAFLDWQHEHQ